MVCKNCGYRIDAEGVKFCPRCGAKNTQHEETVTKEMLQDNISRIWPEWHAVSVLGKGSFGTVYHAIRKSKNIESHAAVKVISIPTDKSEINMLRSEGMLDKQIKTYYEEIVEDFENEIRVMESLKGMQNVVSVEDYRIVERKNEFGWDIYIRMELLTPFSDYIANSKLSEKKVIKIGVDICSALELCDKMNIIHRDIKPENIFVNSFGYFKLGDFGIARKLENMTNGLSQKGTYSYMAPEVVYGNEYDARVDTYSLGLVLYRLLNNNRMPFVDTQKPMVSANERKEANERRIKGEPLSAPINASKRMAEIILKACEYNPDDRFSSPTEMKKELLKLAARVPQSKVIVNDGTATEVANPVATPQKVKPSIEKPIAPPVRNDNYVVPPSPMVKYEEINKEEEKRGVSKTVIAIIAIVVALAILISSLFIFREPISNFIHGLGNKTEETSKKDNKRKTENKDDQSNETNLDAENNESKEPSTDENGATTDQMNPNENGEEVSGTDEENNGENGNSGTIPGESSGGTGNGSGIVNPGIGDTQIDWEGTYEDFQATTSNEEMIEYLHMAGYEYDAKQQIFYTHLNPWQRQMGFTDDLAAPLTNMWYLILKVDFSYGDYDWRLQWWKGQYGVLEGAELGVYTKNKGSSGNFYECAADESLLKMEMEYYQTTAKYNKGDRLFIRKEQEHWWLTGFKFGVTEPTKCVVVATLYARDNDMADKIEEGLQNVTDEKGNWNGFVPYTNGATGSDFYIRSGNVFKVIWRKAGYVNYYYAKDYANE